MEQIYDILVETARAGRLISYSELARRTGMGLLGRDRCRLRLLLQACCKGEVDEGRPMLGSVVVRKDTGMPGEGYFRAAVMLGRLDGRAETAKRCFWMQELQRVYDHWSSH